MGVILKGYTNPNFRKNWASVNVSDIAKEYVRIMNVLSDIRRGVYSYKKETILDSYLQGLSYVRNCLVDKIMQELGFFE